VAGMSRVASASDYSRAPRFVHPGQIANRAKSVRPRALRATASERDGHAYTAGPGAASPSAPPLS